MDNKTFTSKLSRTLGRDTKDVTALINGLSVILRERCSAMDSVAIPSFGTFTPKKVDEQISTDLSTGQRLLLPPQIVLTFNPSNILKKHLTTNE
jgi:DNA-binding protein HU-beta/integration host factor subunit alpha